MKNWIVVFFVFISFKGFGQEAVDTATVRAEVDSLIALNLHLLKRRELEKALMVIENAKQKIESTFGKMREDYALSTFNYGLTFHYMGDFDKAEYYYLEAKVIRKKVLGENHPDYAKNLNNLGALYVNKGDYQKAESYHLKAKNIREKIYGKNHLDYAQSLHNLSDIRMKVGDYETAETLLLEANDIKKRIDENHPEYIRGIINLASLYFDIGNFEKAKPLFLEAKRINKKVYGEDHLNYATSLFGLALLYGEFGNYESAKTLYLRVQPIFKKAYGERHPMYANLLNSMAIVYEKMGNYDNAESIFIEAIKIQKEVLGENHIEYSRTLTNLAILKSRLGNYEKAKELFTKAKNIKVNVLGKKHKEYADALHTLGVLNSSTGNYKESETFLLEAMEVHKEVLGNEHPDFARNLQSLSSLYIDMKLYDKAEPLAKEALRIQEEVLGKEHPDFIYSLGNLARLYINMENYGKAEQIYIDVNKNVERSVGKEHRLYTGCLKEQAYMYSKMGLFEKAIPLYLELSKSLRFHIETSFSFLSENEKEAFLRKEIIPIVSQLQSAAFSQSLPSLWSMQFDLAILTKGLQLQASKGMLEFIMQEKDSTILNTYHQLLGVRRRLAKQYELPVFERQGITELEIQQEGFEKELARASTSFKQELAAFKITWKEVSAALKPGEAAIEFVHFDYKNPDPTDSVMYAAVVLLPNASKPYYISLFEENVLNQFINDNSSNSKTLYANRSIVPKKKKIITKNLYNFIWQPIDSVLTGVSKVYYSPSGLLNRLNLGAIQIGEGKILSDKYDLSAMSSTRSLALEKYREGYGNLALVFGGIKYEYDSLNTTNTLVVDSVNISNTGSGLFSYVNRSLLTDKWTYLNWTEKESITIHQLLSDNGFDSNLKTGYLASEQAFKRIGGKGDSPRIIHLATHGFFFPDPVDTLRSYTNEPYFKISDHPMIRSGLILAGANRAWKGAKLIPSYEDGILTAYEISQLNLTGTELVVLSACETGLGDIKGNEGVYGLQRAFKIAGARYLIMSLWQVPDKQTQELMTSFYSKWLEDKMDIPQAFQAAQREMRTKHKDPYLWAGFVLME